MPPPYIFYSRYQYTYTLSPSPPPGNVKKKRKKNPKLDRSIVLTLPPPLTAQKPTNRILAHVRPGGGRSTADFNTLCERITESWNHILSPPTETEEGGSSNEERNSGKDRYRDEERDGKGGNGEGGRDRDNELRAIFVLGTIVAGREVGFELPAVSTKTGWLILGFVLVIWGMVFGGSLYGWF